MARIIEKTLKDGSHLEIHCLRFPGETQVPEWMKTLYGAPEITTGWSEADGQGYRQQKLCGWERYYADVFSGASAGECTDYLYGALMDGKPAARLWFGYSDRTGSGNFGNVFTLPEYRKRGIMTAMLEALKEDWNTSKALFLSCNAAGHAAPAYSAVLGFRRIISPEDSAMAAVKPEAGSFQEVLKRAYGESRNALIRSGRRGDRFDIDKLLYYAPELYLNRQSSANLFSTWLPDYLHAFPCAVSGKAAISVVESASGVCAGYAFAKQILPDVTGVIFSLHPAFSDRLPELIEHACQDFSGNLLLCPNSRSEACQTVLQKTGFRELGCGLYEEVISKVWKRDQKVSLEI